MKMILKTLTISIFVVNVVGVIDFNLVNNELDSELCDQQLRVLMNNPSIAFNFIDATGKIPPGMLTGNLQDFGDYHECLKINVHVNTTDIYGKYCLLHIPLEQNPIKETNVTNSVLVEEWKEQFRFLQQYLEQFIVEEKNLDMLQQATRFLIPEESNISQELNQILDKEQQVKIFELFRILQQMIRFPIPEESSIFQELNQILDKEQQVKILELFRILQQVTRFPNPEENNTSQELNQILDNEQYVKNLEFFRILQQATRFPNPEVLNISQMLNQILNKEQYFEDVELVRMLQHTATRLSIPEEFNTSQLLNKTLTNKLNVENFRNFTKITTKMLTEWSNNVLRRAFDNIGFEKSAIDVIHHLRNPTEGTIPAAAYAFQLNLGLCIPKVCTPRQAFDFVLRYIPFVNINFTSDHCRLPNDKPLDTVDIAAIVFLSLFGLITITSTSYDIHHVFVQKRDPSKANALYQSFSVYTNTFKLLTLKCSPGEIQCLDGIRSLSILWVVVGHSYFWIGEGYLHNFVYFINWLGSLESTWVAAGPITVDTFFLLSGILCVYVTLEKFNRANLFVSNIHMFYLNRILRIFPLLIFTIIVLSTIISNMSDGPNWQLVDSNQRQCRKYWWAAILHIQNYYNPFPLCIFQAWFLSVDMQLYIFSPVVLAWLFGKKHHAWLALGTAVVSSLIIVSAYSFYYDFPGSLFSVRRFDRIADYAVKYYMNTLCRASPFMIGMLFGYWLHQMRDEKLRISRYVCGALWVLSLLTMALVIYSSHYVLRIDHDNRAFDRFSNAYIKCLWAFSVGWMIVACHHGLGGPINWFLSLQLWKLLSRLSYAMFLTHTFVIIISDGSFVKAPYFTAAESFYRCLADVILTITASFCVSVAIEAPFLKLQKILINNIGPISTKIPAAVDTKL